MRYIGDGKVHDTNNSELVAQRMSDDEIKRTETTLYKDPSGHYFAVHAITWIRNGETERGNEWENVGTASQALAYCAKQQLTIFEDIEGLPLPQAKSSSIETRTRERERV